MLLSLFNPKSVMLPEREMFCGCLHFLALPPGQLCLAGCSRTTDLRNLSTTGLLSFFPTIGQEYLADGLFRQKKVAAESALTLLKQELNKLPLGNLFY